MEQDNYSRTITVLATPEAVFTAVTRDLSKWWSEIDGFEKPGDVATITFPPNRTYWTFRAKTLKPAALVELECIEADHILVDAPDASRTEWLRTTLAWHIEPNGAGTTVRFTHDGLRPGLACYDVCAAGWDHFVGSSLQAYLESGVGRPGHRGSQDHGKTVG